MTEIKRGEQTFIKERFIIKGLISTFAAWCEFKHSKIKPHE